MGRKKHEVTVQDVNISRKAKNKSDEKSEKELKDWREKRFKLVTRVVDGKRVKVKVFEAWTPDNAHVAKIELTSKRHNWED